MSLSHLSHKEEEMGDVLTSQVPWPTVGEAAWVVDIVGQFMKRLGLVGSNLSMLGSCHCSRKDSFMAGESNVCEKSIYWRFVRYLFSTFIDAHITVRAENSVYRLMFYQAVLSLSAYLFHSPAGYLLMRSCCSTSSWIFKKYFILFKQRIPSAVIDQILWYVGSCSEIWVLAHSCPWA